MDFILAYRWEAARIDSWIQELGSAPESFTSAVAFMLRSNVVSLTSNYQLEEVMG